MARAKKGTGANPEKGDQPNPGTEGEAAATAAAAEKPKRGRPPKSDQAPPKTLTDAERRALTAQHVPMYEKALRAKKDADAEFKNVCRRIKAEGGAEQVDRVKDQIALADPKTADKLKAAVQRQIEVMEWLGAIPVGTQLSLFGEDRTPAVDRARNEGHQAGVSGQSMRPPYAPELPQYTAWVEGWQAGQAETFNIQKLDTPPPAGNAPPPASDTIGMPAGNA